MRRIYTPKPKLRRRNTIKEALETVPGEKRSWNGLVGDIHRELIPNVNRLDLPSNSPLSDNFRYVDGQHVRDVLTYSG